MVGNVKYTLYNAVKAHRGSRVEHYPFFTSTLEGAGWSTPHPAAVPPRRGPLYRRLSGPNGRTEIKCNEGLGRMFGDAP